MLILGTTYAYYKTKINGNSKDKSISVLSKYLAAIACQIQSLPN